MRLVDGDRLAGLLLVGGGEGGVDVLVEFARHIIGDVEQRGVGAGGNGADECDGCGKAGIGENTGEGGHDTFLNV